MDYTFNDDVSRVLSCINKIHRVEIRRYVCVANNSWNEAIGQSRNNLLSFRMNQCLALRSIANSTESYHLVMDNFIRTKHGSRFELNIPDRANFVSFVDNRTGQSLNGCSYSSLFYIQPHIAKMILAGYSNGTLNMFDSLRNLPKEEIELDNSNTQFEYYRYPNFTLSEIDVINRSVMQEWD